MQATDYHVQKENEAKTLNRMAKLVVENRFDEDTKLSVVEDVKTAVDAILENRKEVYKEVEDFDFKEEYDFNHDINNTLQANEKNVDKNHTRYVAHSVSELAAQLKVMNTPGTTFVMNSSNLQKYFPTKKFKKNESLILACLDNISDLMNAETKEEEPTEEEVAESKKNSSSTKDGSKKAKKTVVENPVKIEDLRAENPETETPENTQDENPA